MSGTKGQEKAIDKMLDIFEQDLMSLAELTVTNGPVQLRHVRQASVILRRWLCDNQLSVLAQKISVSATLPVFDDEYIFQLIDTSQDINYYLSAGVKFDGKPVHFLYHSNSDEIAPWLNENFKLEIKELNPSKALNKKVLYYDKIAFNMREVILFVCNKLGGAHYSDGRRERHRTLEKASDYLTFGGELHKMKAPPSSEVHMSIEPDAKEYMSGVFVVVISASAMLLNVRFDGDPVVEWG